MEFQRIQTSQSDATQEILKWVANFVLILDCLMNSILKKDVFFFQQEVFGFFFFAYRGKKLIWAESQMKSTTSLMPYETSCDPCSSYAES